MRPHQEHSPHELYIRAMPPTKTTAPLKFYANVTGKFMVDRQLGSRVESLVRDKTTAAEKQRTERKTILLDAPPPSAPPVKAAKKKVPTAKRHTAVDSSRTLSASTSTQPSRMVSPRPPTVHAKDPAPSRSSPRPPAVSALRDSDRGRLVHFLALRPRTLSEVMRNVGGVNDDQPLRQDLIELLKIVSGAYRTTGTSTDIVPSPHRSGRAARCQANRERGRTPEVVAEAEDVARSEAVHVSRSLAPGTAQVVWEGHVGV